MRESVVDKELSKRIELAKREWETTVDTIKEGLALYDSISLEVRRVNWPFASLFSSNPKIMVGAHIHEILCNCEAENCAVRDLLISSEFDTLDVWRIGSGQFWSLSVYPISAISGSKPHFQHNVVVIRDITEERQLQQRIVDAEKHAYMVELVDHLIDRVNPAVDGVREELEKIPGHLIALREVLWRLQTTLDEKNNDRTENSYPEIAFKEIEQALSLSEEYLDTINKVIGCLDEIEVSTGHMQRSEIEI